MKKIAALAAAVFLFAVGPLHAQPVTPATADSYAGPRFPGGPDSLRALVGRSLRAAPVGLTGLLAVHMELKGGRQPGKFELLVPSAPVNPALMAAGKRAMAYLKAQMPEWQFELAKSGKLSDKNIMTLSLNFGANQSAKSCAYAYADSEPVFPDLAPLLTSKGKDYYNQQMAKDAALGTYKTSSQRKMVLFTQMAVQYPPQAMRAGQQGQVMLYFEVSETGNIENHQIVGTAGALLDAEVMRVAQILPNAISPALLLGKPVRVFYTMPVKFAMM